MIRTLPILFCFLLFISVQPLQAQTKKADWILNYPIQQEYFIGIAYALKSTPDYLQTAKQKALQSLAGEIAIKIVGQTSLQTTESQQKVVQNYVNTVKTETVKDLEGFELVDTWQDDKEYWVYYRLSKQTYYQGLRDKAATALASATEHVQQAKKYITDSDFQMGIQQYLKSALLIQGYLNFEYDNEIKTSIHLLNRDIRNELLNVIQNMRFTVSTDNIQLSVFNTRDFSIGAQVVSGTQAVKSLPFMVRILEGDLVFSETRVESDPNGRIQFNVDKISITTKRHRVRLELNSAALFDSYSKQYCLLAAELTDVVKVFKDISIQIAEVPVWIETEEKAFTTPIKEKQVMGALRQALLKKGFSLATSSAKSDYILKVEANTTKGNIAYEMQVVYLNATFNLTETQSGKNVWTYQLPQVKGLKSDAPAASHDAYLKLIRNLDKEVLPEMYRAIGVQ